mmetsp:Transcript_23221/g.36005  ORF Transcript_23221/g.36005 Transcript_23221/m.36005 type:complete len:339 (+) Transcript_23221:153-1169(+)
MHFKSRFCSPHISPLTPNSSCTMQRCQQYVDPSAQTFSSSWRATPLPEQPRLRASLSLPDRDSSIILRRKLPNVVFCLGWMASVGGRTITPYQTRASSTPCLGIVRACGVARSLRLCIFGLRTWFTPSPSMNTRSSSPKSTKARDLSLSSIWKSPVEVFKAEPSDTMSAGEKAMNNPWSVCQSMVSFGFFPSLWYEWKCSKCSPFSTTSLTSWKLWAPSSVKRMGPLMSNALVRPLEKALIAPATELRNSSLLMAKELQASVLCLISWRPPGPGIVLVAMVRRTVPSPKVCILVALEERAQSWRRLSVFLLETAYPGTLVTDIIPYSLRASKSKLDPD